jgi:hypothetical protein
VEDARSDHSVEKPVTRLDRENGVHPPGLLAVVCEAVRQAALEGVQDAQTAEVCIFRDNFSLLLSGRGDRYMH